MRLTEVSETPGYSADEAKNGQAVGKTEKAFDRNLRERTARTATFAEHHDQGHYDQRDDHDEALDEVRQAHRQETANHGIGKHDQRRDPDAQHVIGHAHIAEQSCKACFEQLAATDKSCSGIYREEDHHDQSRHDPQRHGPVWEAIGEEFRNGQRIAIALGLFAQTRRHDEPIGQCADEKTDADPCFDQAAGIERAGQAEQQPAAHVRSASRKRGHRRVQIATGEEIPFAGVGGAFPSPQTDRDHENKI